VLRALAILYLVMACVTALAGIAGAIYLLVASRYGGALDRTFLAIGAIVATFYFVVTMLAIAEVIKLFIDMEHNTRMAWPGRIGMPQSVSTVTMSSEYAGDGGRLADLDEETAEAALIRGH
jgi:hypothetical protein